MTQLSGEYRIRTGAAWLAPAHPGWRVTAIRNEAALFNGSLTREASSAQAWLDAKGLLGVFESVSE